MKKTKLLASVALISASAMLVAAPSYAIGYDTITDNKASGGREDELHAIIFTTRLEDCADDPSNPGTTFCESSFSLDSEFTAVLNVQNATPCTPIGVLGGACRNLNAGAGTNTNDVPDTYAGGAFNTADGPTPGVAYASIFLPDCPEAGAAGACFRETALTSAFYSWNFNTNEAGKILQGYLISDSNFGESGQTVGVFIFGADGTRTVRTYRGAASDGFPNAADRDCVVDPSAAWEGCWNPSVPGTGGPSAEQDFEYITVPDIGLDLAKAVPVPAFAAAVLGLGLIGITVLTGRRRQIK